MSFKPHWVLVTPVQRAMCHDCKEFVDTLWQWFSTPSVCTVSWCTDCIERKLA